MKRLVTIVFALLISVAGLAQIEIIPSGGGVGEVTLDNTATLYNKTLDGNTCIVPGSSTQNFSVATLTVGNVSMDADILYTQTASQPIGSAAWLAFPFNNKVRDAGNNVSGSTFTAPSSGLYIISMAITGQANKAGAGNQIAIYLVSAGFSSVSYGSPVVGATDFPMCTMTTIVRLSAGQTITWSTIMAQEAGVSCYPDGMNNYIAIARIR